MRRISRNLRSGPGASVALVALAVLGAIWWGTDWMGGASGPDPAAPFSFEETLPEVIADFGSDALIVSIMVGPTTLEYQLLTAGDEVTVRYYAIRTENVMVGLPGGGNTRGTGRTRVSSDRVRPPTDEERRAAVLRLDQLEREVVDLLYEHFDTRQSTSIATLRGQTWTLRTGNEAHEAPYHLGRPAPA